MGEIPVHVTINDLAFDCNLDPLKNGYYNIPLTDEQANEFEENPFYPVVFTVRGKENNEIENSPYSYENPIRKVDGINILIQPWDGLCGQTAFEEAGNIMHCREWQANMAKIVPSLDYVGIKHANKIIYTKGKDVELPKCCIIMENLGRFSHYLVGYDGKYYDPNNGIMTEIDKANIKGYLEIICD